MTEVIGKKGLLLLIILLTLLLTSLALLMSVPVKSEDPYVKVYVDQPLGYIPGVAPGEKFTFDVLIETSGIADGTAAGIIQWGMESICVDPEVLDIDTTVSGFPPSYKAKFSTGAGHFLYEFAAMMGYSAPSLFLGGNDPVVGCQADISETGLPSYATGAGDSVSSMYPKLLTVELTSKSDTESCVIDLITVRYRTGDGLWHEAEEVIDGFYNAPPTQYDLTIAVPVHGTTDPVPGTYAYDEGSPVEVTAIPDGGWTLDYWDLDGADVGDANPYTVTMNADHTLTAFFTEITVPTIKSCDSSGIEKNTFKLDDEVWVIGSNFESEFVDIYAVQDVPEWSDFAGSPISELTIMDMKPDVETDTNGNIPAMQLWTSGLVPGMYDIVVDVDQNGIYDHGVDVLDDYQVETAGFFVIPELWLGTILGLLACFAAFGVFYASKRKHLSDGLAR